MRKSRKMLELERQHGKPIEVLVTDALTSQGTIARAAASLGVNTTTFWGWMLRLRVKVKKVAIVA